MYLFYLIVKVYFRLKNIFLAMSTNRMNIEAIVSSLEKAEDDFLGLVT